MEEIDNQNDELLSTPTSRKRTDWKNHSYDIEKGKMKGKGNQSLLKNMKTAIINDRETKKVFIYVVLLFINIFMKLYYSAKSNSIAFLASAAYTCIDFVSLLMCLISNAAEKKGISWQYSYGWTRMEIVLQFSSVVFLLFLCLYIFFESIERMLEVEPSYVHSEILMAISLFSIIYQFLCTIFIYKKKVQSHSSHSPHLFSHEPSSPTNSPGFKSSPNTSFNNNIKNFKWNWKNIIFGDIAADISIFISALIIHQQGWFIFDTLCAFYISTFILAYCIPKLQETSMVLLQATPQDLVGELSKKVKEAATVEGVLETRKANFWSQNFNEYVGSLTIRISSDSDSQKVVQKIKKLFEPYLHHFTVQCEKLILK